LEKLKLLFYLTTRREEVPQKRSLHLHLQELGVADKQSRIPLGRMAL
jgi:hypothetical protein